MIMTILLKIEQFVLTGHFFLNEEIVLDVMKFKLVLLLVFLPSSVWMKEATWMDLHWYLDD
jgi:hypothetical protein